MAFIPVMIPLGVSLARISRNSNDDDDGKNKVPHSERGRGIVDKMMKGGANAPITEWSEAKLEKAIRRSSIIRDHANELRLARVNGLLSAATEGAQAKSSKGPKAPVARVTPVAPVVDSGNAEEGHSGNVEEGQDGNIPDTLCQADLLLLAAETESKGNPVRDAALELLADNSYDAILITDPGGLIAYSNKAFKKLTGYDQADVVGKSPKLLQGPGTDKKVLRRLKDSMNRGLGDYEGSAINYRKDGTPFIMHWRVVPVKVGGEIKAWVAIQREGSEIQSGDLA